MIKILKVQSNKRIELIDITQEVRNIVSESSISEGICWLFVPHTTAGITINESADPMVVVDIQEQLNKLIPYHSNYKHLEGNADAHIKSTITGIDNYCFIENGKIMLGTWQGIFFCEYDGPRERKVLIKIIEG
ncbi:MAG: YjbQ family protein [Candidatus Cloacimonadota bacterium]|nr:MAG: YjbQ family protein [Candidatus Cloacimonadota bacterium]